MIFVKVDTYYLPAIIVHKKNANWSMKGLFLLFIIRLTIVTPLSNADAEWYEVQKL